MLRTKKTYLLLKNTFLYIYHTTIKSKNKDFILGAYFNRAPYYGNNIA